MSQPILLSPHDDDHALFAAFTCLRERPLVVVVFDSYVQANRGLPVTAEERSAETERACRILGCDHIRLGFRDDDPSVGSADICDRLVQTVGPIAGRRIFAPLPDNFGHPQHDVVGFAASNIGNAAYYATYTGTGKTVTPNRVNVEDPEWIRRKLLALAEYRSQMSLDLRMGCWPHFLRSQEEYYA